MAGKTKEDIEALIEAAKVADPTPVQREALVQEATRTLPAAIAASSVIPWFRGYVQKGLGYKVLGKIMMGRRSAAQIRKEGKKPRPAPSPYGYEPGDEDYSGEVRR